MKQKYLFILYLFFNFIQIFAQNTGDFRSIANGNWESLSSWEVYNGTTSNWDSATFYPGENTGTTNTVTISNGNTISITSNLTTAEMGSVIVNGTLDLNPPSPFNITLSTLHLFIDGGVLNFNGPQISLNLPLRASPNPSPYIEIKNGGTIGGSCTHNDEILIGNNVYAVCKTTGSSDYVTFGEIATSGGTINAVINLPPSNATSCKDQPITLEGHYEGAAGSTVNYQWTATDPNGDPITIANGILSNNSDLASTSFTPTIFGNYLISFTVSTDISGINFSNTVTNLVIIEDTQAPIINCPITSNANRNTNANLCTYTADETEFNATATDNCAVTSLTYALSGDTTGSGTSLAGVVFNKGVTTVTWSASDGVNAAVNCSFTVTISDIEKPILTPETNQDVTLDANCLVTIPNLVDGSTATDNCSVVT
ncbi:hypothetical protein, partial [Flavobacterium daejeonense]|uniref:hypothetical protein n=1 Tax=Flavobacterium daejeonense TaxID=350893 RepID=UPI000554F98E